MRSLIAILLLAAGIAAGAMIDSVFADNTANEADTTWKAVQKALRPPAPPPEWQTNRPSPEEIERFQQRQGALAAEAAVKSKDFYTRFPDHAKAAEARKKEYEMTAIAVRLGYTNAEPRLAALEADHARDPNLSEDERFELRSRSAQRAAMKKQSEGMAAVLAELEKGARELQKEFPKRSEAYEMLIDVASQSDGDRGRRLAREIVDGPAPDEIKERAKALLKKMD